MSWFADVINHRYQGGRYARYARGALGVWRVGHALFVIVAYFVTDNILKRRAAAPRIGAGFKGPSGRRLGVAICRPSAATTTMMLYGGAGIFCSIIGGSFQVGCVCRAGVGMLGPRKASFTSIIVPCCRSGGKDSVGRVMDRVSTFTCGVRRNGAMHAGVGHRFVFGRHLGSGCVRIGFSIPGMGPKAIVRCECGVLSSFCFRVGG